MSVQERFWLFVGLAVLFGSGLVACRDLAPPEPPAGVSREREGSVHGTPPAGDTPTQWVADFHKLPPGPVSRVAVVYFHRTERCTACLNAEDYTRETLKTHFAGPLNDGWISLQVLDVQRPENAALASKYDATGSALYLGILIQGTEYLYSAQDIWFYTSNKYLFVDSLKKKLGSLIGRK